MSQSDGLGRGSSRHPGVPRVNEGGTCKPQAQRHWLGLLEPEGGRAPDEGELKQGRGSPSTSRNRTSMLLSHPPTRKQRLRTRVRSLCFILLCIWDKCIVILRTPGGENQFATQTQRRNLGGILHWDRLRQPLRDAQRMSPWKESTNECVNLLELNMNMRHQYGTLSGQ